MREGLFNFINSKLADREGEIVQETFSMETTNLRGNKVLRNAWTSAEVSIIDKLRNEGRKHISAGCNMFH